MSAANYILFTPAPLLRSVAAYTFHSAASARNFRGAFGRRAQPYSGAAPRDFSQAKVGRGLRFSKLALLANKI